MHMWMWFGYDLGEFLLAGLSVSTRWTFALTWIVVFLVSVGFEGSKVYLASVQREALKKLHPYRSDERRNLLCDREQGAGTMEPTTSRNTSNVQVDRWAALKVKMLVNLHQAIVFVAHNMVGYLLMLAVMLYNVQLLLAVLLGLILGYFLFGTQLIRLQMQCYNTKRVVICTPECDDTAENTTPPLLDSSLSSESDFFTCQTRTCIQPSHYYRATTSQDDVVPDQLHATCYYGAKKCPSKVARANKLQMEHTKAQYHHESEKEDSPSVEDVQLLRTERQGCCKKIAQLPAGDKKCCRKKSSQETTVTVHPMRSACCQQEISKEENIRRKEDGSQIICCHNTKSSTTESQEQIIS